MSTGVKQALCQPGACECQTLNECAPVGHKGERFDGEQCHTWKWPASGALHKESSLEIVTIRTRSIQERVPEMVAALQAGGEDEARKLCAELFGSFFDRLSAEIVRLPGEKEAPPFAEVLKTNAELWKGMKAHILSLAEKESHPTYCPAACGFSSSCFGCGSCKWCSNSPRRR